MNNYGNKLVAHQGESYIAPGNTLSSFALAWIKGAKIVELDMRITRDKQLIVCHDANFNRVANDPRIIYEHDIDDFANVDVGIKKGANWEGENPPSLKQALKQAVELMPRDGKMFLEVKDGAEAVPLLKEILQSLGEEHLSKWIITSFKKDVIETARQALANCETSWITKLEYEN